MADRQEIIDRLRQNEAALRARGVSHAARSARVPAATTGPTATSTS